MAVVYHCYVVSSEIMMLDYTLWICILLSSCSDPEGIHQWWHERCPWWSSVGSRLVSHSLWALLYNQPLQAGCPDQVDSWVQLTLWFHWWCLVFHFQNTFSSSFQQQWHFKSLLSPPVLNLCLSSKETGHKKKHERKTKSIGFNINKTLSIKLKKKLEIKRT